MNYLPISTITEEDGPLVGKDLVRLAILKRAHFPVDEGIAVLAPIIQLKTTLEYFNLKDKEIFEQRLSLFKQEIAKIPVPEDLAAFLLKKKVNAHATWQSLLEIWFNEIRRRFWAGGFDLDITKNLPAHPVFFTSKILGQGKTFFDPVEQAVKVVMAQAGLEPIQLKTLDEAVPQMNKRLFLPQVYHWMTTSKLVTGLKIIKVQEYTGSEQVEPAESTKQPKLAPKELSQKTATTVFQNLGSSFVLEPGVGGVVVDALETGDFDQQVLQLVEAAHSLPNCSVVFKLSDKAEKFGGLRGTLRLIHQTNLLKSEAGAFLFARHKKQLLNLELAIPFTRSVTEFLQLKRELASIGVSRKATLKFWFEIAVPENIINLTQYLEAGFDGVILNLDELANWIGGFDPGEPESQYYTPNFAGPALLKTLAAFLDQTLTTLHKNKTPVLASGKYALTDDLLEFLLERGVKGVIVDRIGVAATLEHLHFLEKRLVRKRLN